MRSPSALAVDVAFGLLITNAGSNRISGFSGAFGPGGDLIPERYVGGPTLNQPEAMAYDRARDLLFVSNLDTTGTIAVWSNVSSADFTGEVQPARRLQSSAIGSARDLELTPSGELYVLSSGYSTIPVYPNAASSSGAVTPARTIRSPAFIEGSLMDAFIDAGDRLYVVGIERTEILVFDKASTLNGDVMPNRVLTLARAHSFGGIAVDAAGTAYVTDLGVNAVYVIEGVATKHGTLTPDRTVVGAKTGLAAPGHLAVVIP